MTQTLRDVLLSSPGFKDDKVAVVIPESGVKITYKDFTEQIQAAVNTLIDTGLVEVGQTVAVVLPNGFPFLVSFLAVTWARRVAAPLNAAYTLEEFTFYLEDLEAKLLIVPPGEHLSRQAAKKLNIPVLEITYDDNSHKAVLEARASPAKDEEQTKAREQHKKEGPRPEDVALFLHTSGTTSKPKGVPLTHKNLAVSISNVAGTYKLTTSDSSLILMPLFHVHGLIGATLSTLLAGGNVVVPARFSASAFKQQADTFGVTWYSAVPTIHHILLSRDDCAPAKTLRFIRSCSSALAPAELEKLEKRFQCPVLEAYGMTEASHQMASNPLPSEGSHKPGSVGKGTNVQIAVLDDNGAPVATKATGEICIKGENVTHGYHNNPDANKANWTKDGWFKTGDQGYLDEEGYLFMTGRIKELINRGGEKISPLEIDHVLSEHPQVSEAICFGVPEPKYGEEVHAAVVLKAENAATEQDIIKFCTQRLTAFKVPKKIYITDKLPRTATGKLQRKAIAAHFTEQKK